MKFFEKISKFWVCFKQFQYFEVQTFLQNKNIIIYLNRIIPKFELDGCKIAKFLLHTGIFTFFTKIFIYGYTRQTVRCRHFLYSYKVVENWILYKNTYRMSKLEGNAIFLSLVITTTIITKNFILAYSRQLVCHRLLLYNY